jgi:putative membrane protein
MQHKNILPSLLIGALAAAAPLAGFAQQPTQQEDLSSVDRQFVQQAMKANAKEIKSADVERNSSDRWVRTYAQTMVRDHGTSVSQLAALANQYNVPYPTEGVVKNVPSEGAPPRGVPSSATSGNVSVQAMPARQYMQQQIADHQQAIALYQNEMKNGTNQALKSYAGQTLPHLKAHLTMAQQYIAVGRFTPEPAPTPCEGGESC